jgi:hypothetical protein
MDSAEEEKNIEEKNKEDRRSKIDINNKAHPSFVGGGST